MLATDTWPLRLIPAAFVEPQPRLPGRKAQHEAAREPTRDPQEASQRAVGDDLSELENNRTK